VTHCSGVRAAPADPVPATAGTRRGADALIPLRPLTIGGFAPATTRATWKVSLPLFWPMLGLSLLQWLAVSAVQTLLSSLYYVLAIGVVLAGVDDENLAAVALIAISALTYALFVVIYGYLSLTVPALATESRNAPAESASRPSRPSRPPIRAVVPAGRQAEHRPRRPGLRWAAADLPGRDRPGRRRRRPDGHALRAGAERGRPFRAGQRPIWPSRMLANSHHWPAAVSHVNPEICHCTHQASRAQCQFPGFTSETATRP
jgi:hypothetical protein